MSHKFLKLSVSPHVIFWSKCQRFVNCLQSFYRSVYSYLMGTALRLLIGTKSLSWTKSISTLCEELIIFKHNCIFQRIFFCQVEEARQLDTRQKEALSIAVNYAKRVVTFQRGWPNQHSETPSRSTNSESTLSNTPSRNSNSKSTLSNTPFRTSNLQSSTIF